MLCGTPSQEGTGEDTQSDGIHDNGQQQRQQLSCFVLLVRWTMLGTIHRVCIYYHHYYYIHRMEYNGGLMHRQPTQRHYNTAVAHSMYKIDFWTISIFILFVFMLFMLSYRFISFRFDMIRYD